MSMSKKEIKEQEKLFIRGLRKCSKCGKVKCTNEFFKDSSKKYGIYSRCKICSNKYRYNSIRRPMKDKLRLFKIGVKKCSTCSYVKTVNCFHKSKFTYDKLCSKCKKCGQNYYQENKDIIIKRRKAYCPEARKNYNKKQCSSISFIYKINTKDPFYKSKFENGQVLVKCYHCKKLFMPTNLEVYHFLIAETGLGNLYCSSKCKQSCSIFNRSKYPKGFKTNTSREVQPELRKMRLKIDNNQCQVCFSKENLHCHHYKGVELNPIESADLDNCITLCKNCHKELHKTPDYTYQDYKRKPCKV